MVKFHYVNRKSEGLKLGQVVAKDLLKRIPPGPSHKAATRDPSVDLDVSGKALSDEAFGEIADALVKSMSYDGEHGKVVKLEEICLKDNALTAPSLRMLARVVALASADLMDLDLSDNSFSVVTNDEVDAWEEFLESVSECYVLRRVDLSGNALGTRAFEILARVYGKSMSIKDAVTVSRLPSESGMPHSPGDQADDLDRLGQTFQKTSTFQTRTGSISKGSTKLEMDLSDDTESSEEFMPVVQKPLAMPLTTSNACSLYSRTRGLRSVPYLIVANTSMDDICAQHLSYIIASHNSPRSLLQFIPPAKAGPPAQQLETYDQIPGCRGLIYRPNDKIGSAGNKVLELAELVRKNPFEETDTNIKTVEDTVHNIPNIAGRRGSDAQTLHSPSVTPLRRRSILPIESPDQTSPSSSRATELQRARSRIQGDTLRDSGSQSNDLWHKSLKMLSIARTILLEPRKMPESTELRALRELPKPSNPGRNRDAECKPVFSTPSYGTKTAFPKLPPPRPLAPASSNLPIVLRLPHRRKISNVQLTLAMTPALSPTDARIVPPVHKSEKNESTYRSPLLGGLDEKLWSRIISLASGATGILGAEQALSVVRWAQDRASLHREMEALGKAESAQIWKLLEGMGCLAYVVEA